MLKSVLWFYLLFISWFICSRRWCNDKLGVFHVTSLTKLLCVLIHIWTKGEVGTLLNRFKASSKIFFYRPFQGGTSFVDHLCYLCFVFVSCTKSELRVKSACCETSLSPPVKYHYWPFLSDASFVDHLRYFCLFFVMLTCASVYWCLWVTCWVYVRADLLALVCDV